MQVITRFAPSPTGYLHVGNVRTALINWLFARANNGEFILRIDDTDMERSKKEYADAIKEDLEWLGLNWDATYNQSNRMDLYEAAKNDMIKSGRLYPCFETQEELEVKKKVLLSRNLPPIYDRSALKLSPEEIAGLKQNINPHYRFKLDEQKIHWHDGIRGDIEFDPRKISDQVLVRADGTMTYMIATVVDDIDLKITDIIRGEDHITNTAVHSQMFAALGGKMPQMAHLSLIKSKDGEISKRLGGFEIRALREAGMHPNAILSFLVKLGSSDSIEYRKTREELIAEFSLNKFSKSSSNYDLVELERINTKLTHNLTFTEAQKYLPAHIDESFWESIKTNLHTISEIKTWWDICNSDIKISNSDLEFTKNASALLPEGQWDNNTWNIWINEVKQATGRSGKDLFMPIRLALTGMDNGPELKVLLPVLGREKVMSRLNAG